MVRRGMCCLSLGSRCQDNRQMTRQGGNDGSNLQAGSLHLWELAALPVVNTERTITGRRKLPRQASLEGGLKLLEAMVGGHAPSIQHTAKGLAGKRGHG